MANRRFRRHFRRGSQYAFGVTPTIHHSRSRFDLSHKNLTAFNVGQLVPILLEEVLPGDDFKLRANVVSRVTSSFLKPVMDDLFIDMYFFFVPGRLVYDDWEQIWGTASPSQWTDPNYAEVPSTNLANVVKGSLADFFGLPLVPPSSSAPLAKTEVSVLPFRAYALVYNEWFRDENLVDEVLVQKGEATSENFNSNAFSSSNYTGMPAFVSKFHDYFTQLLPAPQKGSPVSFDLTNATATAPAVVAPVTTVDPNTTSNAPARVFPLAWYRSATSGNPNLFDSFVPYTYNTSDMTANLGFLQSGALDDPQSQGVTYTPAWTAGSPSSFSKFAPSNLSAQVPEQTFSLDANSVNINDLRFAFQLQKLLESDARGGSRYIEFLRSQFGVDAGDTRLQRTEFLGGRRVPIGVQQTVQTSQPTSESPLGAVGAFSVTQGRSGTIAKGFTEHGYLLGLACVRQFHTYQQGVRPLWRRKSRTDFYLPVFSNIGEQPVYRSELYATGLTANDDVIFGYKPAWEEYRSSPNMVTGDMRSTADEGLDIWHFADEYSSAPVLGQQWIQETPSNVDRTISVPSSTAPQFIFDFWFEEQAVRVMPTFGVPGLIDHH